MLLLFIAQQPAQATAGYVNAGLVVGEIWTPLNATGPVDAIFWTETELYQWIDEAAARLARRLNGFVVYDQTVVAATGTADYNLPASHLVTLQADLAGSQLRARNVPEMEALDPNWPAAAAAQPRAFLEDTKGVTRLTLAPPPSVTYNGNAVGLVMAKQPATVSAAGAIIAVPPVLQEYFTFYALGEARSKESNASMDEVADWYKSLVGLIEQAAGQLWN